MGTDAKRQDTREKKDREEQERRAGAEEPGKTPGSAEGGAFDQGRDKPFPNEPGKTPGKAEG